MKLSKFKEGEVEILAPAGKPTKALPVFYNPIMKFDRDLTIEVLKNFDFENYCDSLAGTGVRAIRVNKELEKKAFANDVNPNAAKLIKRNALRNKAKVEISECDANIFLTNHKCAKFDVIDIDPFGAFMFYLDSALKSIKRRDGMLCLTSTDLAPLCGTSVHACIRKYNSRPLRTSYCKEIGLRILLASSNMLAAKYELILDPLLSYYRGHYFRIFARTHRGPARVDRQLKRISYLQHCFKCDFRTYVEIDRFMPKCPNCDGKLEWAGPLWNSTMADAKFCKKIDNEITNVVAHESITIPFYDTHRLSKLKKVQTPKMSSVISSLESKGYKVENTHFLKSGIRTNADIVTIYGSL